MKNIIGNSTSYLVNEYHLFVFSLIFSSPNILIGRKSFSILQITWNFALLISRYHMIFAVQARAISTPKIHARIIIGIFCVFVPINHKIAQFIVINSQFITHLRSLILLAQSTANL